MYNRFSPIKCRTPAVYGLSFSLWSGIPSIKIMEYDFTKIISKMKTVSVKHEKKEISGIWTTYQTLLSTKGIRIDDRMALIYKEIASVFWDKVTFW